QQNRAQRPDLTKRQPEHALRLGRVDGDAGRAEAAVEEHLRKQAPEGMAHDDRWLVEQPDDLRVAVNDLGYAQARERRRVASNLFDLALDPRPGRRQDAVATLFVVAAERIPAARGHPRAVDQEDRVRLRSHLGSLLLGWCFYCRRLSPNRHGAESASSRIVCAYLARGPECE